MPGVPVQTTGGQGYNIQSGPDYLDTTVNGTSLGLHVNGVRDLADFFPVWLHIRELLQVLPPAQCDYRLTQEDAGLNFTDTVLKADGQDNEKAGAYLTDNTVAQSLGSKAVQQITASGVSLSADLLNRMTADKTEQTGIILVEGRQATGNPLVLEVFNRATNTSIVKLKLPLSIDGVEKMYGQKNLRYLAGNNEGVPDYKPLPGDEPANFPARLCNGKKFVSLHGYSVSGNAARGWGAEMFKRLYWSGSRARFYAVTWLGNETRGDVPGAPDATPDYHVNVDNAFSAARWLANYLRSLGGADVVAAHSLDNMVTSSAIQDWGAPVGQYFMIDAAVAAEAYSGDEEKNANMVHPLWVQAQEDYTYQERLWASEWHALFPASDNRHYLTWRDRFAGVGAPASNSGPQVYNFYSGTEDTLAEHVGNPDLVNGNSPLREVLFGNGTCAWALQEKLKGRSGVVPRCAFGGWGFNNKYFEPGNEDFPSAIVVNALSSAVLRTDPVFQPGGFAGLYDPATGSDFASPAQNRNRLLAEMMPARTLAAGRVAVEKFSESHNFDMSGSFRNGWPAERFDEDRNRWRHCDYRQVAYLYVYHLYDQFKTIGKLDQ